MPGLFNMELAPGQHVALDTVIYSGAEDMDLARMEDGTTVDGVFWGKLNIIHEGDKHELEFTGTRVPGEYDIPRDYIYNPRLMSKLITAASAEMVAKCHLSILVPTEVHCEVTLGLSPMWRLHLTWPSYEELPSQNKFKFFLRASPGGALEHFGDQVVATSIYYEAVSVCFISI